MKEKDTQRTNDCNECVNWDLKIKALEESWNRGYDYAMGQKTK